MGFTMNKVNKISQIVRLKQMMQRWKTMSLKRRSDSGCSRIPSGSMAVYVGPGRDRFVIPTRFLNLPLFVSLLEKAEEEYGFPSSGGLVLPCEAEFFERVLKLLERDEHKFGEIGLDELLAMLSHQQTVLGTFDSCKVSSNACHGFTPLLQHKATA